jgi:V8-like Glu-specific endopeptidase
MWWGARKNDGSMTHFLDTLPFDFTRPPARELLGFLTDTYYLEPPVRQFVLAAGVKPASIAFGQPMALVWPDILTQARNQDRLRTLLAVIRDGADSAVAARLGELLDAEPPTNPPHEPFDVVTDEGAERRILDEPTLLDVAFLRRGTELAAGVCRLLVHTHTGAWHGTGFHIGGNRLLTNHHVLFDANGDPAHSVEAWFGYERAFDGADLRHQVVRGVPASIRGAADHDWAVIDLERDPPDGTPVIGVDGPQTVRPGDRVYIIQHPNGAPKKIGMIHNEVTHADDDVVQYLTDTEVGSSGSPVFDERWRLVALHHRWVERGAGAGTAYANQGRRIQRVAEALAAAGLN